MSDQVNGSEVLIAGIGKNVPVMDTLKTKGQYVFECYGKDGELKWRDTIDNLITTVGKNDMLDKHLGGSGYTAAWYMGLIGATSYTTGPAVGDTMASHGGWAEFQTYSEGARPTCSFNSASGGIKALSAALTFSITADQVMKGSFITSISTKGGTTGILFSAGTFSGGDKTLQNGDTLSVSYQAQLT